MPWHITKRGNQHCVIKDSDGSTVTCHPSRAKAVAHMKALYAAEKKMREDIRASRNT